MAGRLGFGLDVATVGCRPTGRGLFPGLVGAFDFAGGSAVPSAGAATIGDFSENFYAWAGYLPGSLSGSAVTGPGASWTLGAALGSRTGESFTPAAVTSRTWSACFFLTASGEGSPGGLGTIISHLTLLAAPGTAAGRVIVAPYASTGFHLRVRGVDKGPFGTPSVADGTRRHFAFLLQTDGFAAGITAGSAVLTTPGRTWRRMAW